MLTLERRLLLSIAGKTAVVTGSANGVGLAIARHFVARGANVMFADMDEDKLAKELGATHCINASNINPVDEIKNLTKSTEGVDYSVDCSGFVETIEQAFESIRRGGKTIFASHPPAGKRISIDPFELINGKRIAGSWGGSARPDTDIPLIGKLIQSKKINLEKLISKKYTINNINKAISDFEQGKILRPLIKFSDTLS